MKRSRSMEVEKQNIEKIKEEPKGNSPKKDVVKKNCDKIIKIGIILIGLIVILSIILNIVNSKAGNLKISAESSLEKIVEKNDLETVNYTYNAIARQCISDNCSNENNDNYKYFVSYEGTVTAGIDFKQVKIEVDKKTKKLTITVPEPKITGYNVDIGSLKFIFTKDKYNEASELEKAFKLCKEDLENRSEKDRLILKTAKQNSITVLEAFFKPWIETFNSEYEVEVK